MTRDVSSLTRRTSAGAVLLIPYWIVLVILQFAAPPSLEQRAAADPIILTFRHYLTGYSIPLLIAGVIAAWWIVRRPAFAEIRKELPSAVAGCAVAAAAVVILHFFFGERLPAFIPPEESSKPGLYQGLAAGLIEEVLFRLMIAPGAYVIFRKRLGIVSSRLAAAAVAGVCFALSHELPPSGGSFHSELVTTRVLFPGVFMTLACFWIGPAFITSAHATAHLLIPFFFR